MPLGDAPDGGVAARRPLRSGGSNWVSISWGWPQVTGPVGLVTMISCRGRGRVIEGENDLVGHLVAPAPAAGAGAAAEHVVRVAVQAWTEGHSC